MERKIRITTNLNQIQSGLTRYWKALRRELGDNDELRQDFTQIVNNQLVKAGFSEKVNDQEFILSILNVK